MLINLLKIIREILMELLDFFGKNLSLEKYIIFYFNDLCWYVSKKKKVLKSMNYEIEIIKLC